MHDVRVRRGVSKRAFSRRLRGAAAAGAAQVQRQGQGGAAAGSGAPRDARPAHIACGGTPRYHALIDLLWPGATPRAAPLAPHLVPATGRPHPYTRRTPLPCGARIDQAQQQEEEEEAQQGEYAGLEQRGELVRGLGLEQAQAGPEELSARLPRLPPEQVQFAAAAA